MPIVNTRRRLLACLTICFILVLAGDPSLPLIDLWFGRPPGDGRPSIPYMRSYGTTPIAPLSLRIRFSYLGSICSYSRKDPETGPLAIAFK